MFYSVFGSQPGVNKNMDRVKNPKVMNTENQKPPHPTSNFIVSDGLKINDPLEIWVDWDPDIDLSMGNRVGIAHWEGANLIIAGGQQARRIEGLNSDLAQVIREGGGVLIAALSSGVVSRIAFPATTTLST